MLSPKLKSKSSMLHAPCPKCFQCSNAQLIRNARRIFMEMKGNAVVLVFHPLIYRKPRLQNHRAHCPSHRPLARDLDPLTLPRSHFYGSCRLQAA